MKKPTTLAKLIRLLEKNGFHTNWNSMNSTIQVGKRHFIQSSFQPSLMNLPDDQGLLLTHSTKEQRRILRDRHISYIDANGYVHIDLGTSKRMIIEDHFNRRKETTKKIASYGTISPTLLVSPNSFALIDTLIRTSPEQTQEIQSTLEFCRIHKLYQPKASKIMTGLGAKDLMDLRKKILALPIEWWLFAFDTPATKRKMTAFFDVSQNYYTLDEKLEKIPEAQLLEQINKDFDENVTGGPTLLAKRMGALVDTDITLWVAPSEFSKFRTKYKLIAGTKPGCRSWIIANPKIDLKKAELITHADSPQLDTKTNVMRCIWDLSFSESRLREIREQLLRNFWKNETR